MGGVVHGLFKKNIEASLRLSVIDAYRVNPDSITFEDILLVFKGSKVAM